MFDLFSWSHILILLTVALVVVGPKDLPRLMNIAGRWAGKARNMANEFKKSFDDMARQSELDELRAEVEKLRSSDPDRRSRHRHHNDIERDAQSGRHRGSRSREAPAPRSGEYQISETPAPRERAGPHQAVPKRPTSGRPANGRSRERADGRRRSGAGRHARAADGASDRAAQAAGLGDGVVRHLLCHLLRFLQPDIPVPDRAAAYGAAGHEQRSPDLHRALRSVLHPGEDRHVRRRLPWLSRHRGAALDFRGARPLQA